MGLGVLRVDSGSRFEGVVGSRRVTLPHQGVPQVVMGRAIVRVESDRRPVGRDGRIQFSLIPQHDPQVEMAAGERRGPADRLPEAGAGLVEVPPVPQGHPQVVAGRHALRVGGHRGLEPPQPLADLLRPVDRVRVAQCHEQGQVPGPGPQGAFQHRPPPGRRADADLAEDGREPGRLGQGLRPPDEVG
jgi:hypothetical protein